jgi:hypothetical protein
MIEVIQHSELHSKYKGVPAQENIHNTEWLLEEALV